MWVFLAGDAVGFGTLLAGYGALRAASADWPNPSEVLGINLTAAMTFLLICSSVTMVKALERLQQGRSRPREDVPAASRRSAARSSWACQAYEWTHLIQRGLLVFGNPWGATLFGTTLLHHHRASTGCT